MYNSKDKQVLDLFSPQSTFGFITMNDPGNTNSASQDPSQESALDEKQMNTFDALSLMDSEGVTSLVFNHSSL